MIARPCSNLLRSFRILLYTAVVFLPAGASFAAESAKSFDHGMELLAKRIIERVSSKEKMTAAIIPFENIYEECTGFSNMIAVNLNSALHENSKNSPLKMIERSRIEVLIAETAKNQDDPFDPETAQKLGKLKGVQSLLVGLYSATEEKISVNASLVVPETGDVLSAAGVFFPRTKSLNKILTKKLKSSDACMGGKYNRRSVNRPDNSGKENGAARGSVAGSSEGVPTRAEAPEFPSFESRGFTFKFRHMSVDKAGRVILAFSVKNELYGAAKIALSPKDISISDRSGQSFAFYGAGNIAICGGRGGPICGIGMKNYNGTAQRSTQLYGGVEHVFVVILSSGIPDASSSEQSAFRRPTNPFSISGSFFALVPSGRRWEGIAVPISFPNLELESLSTFEDDS